MSTRYQGTERDENQAVVPGAKIYVLDRTGATLQALTDDLGNALPQPVISDDNGGYYFWVSNPDTYFLKHYWGNYPNPRLLEFIAVGLASDAIFKGDPGTAATIAAGTTTTLAAGSPATVTNVGTSGAAVFNFAIPTGPGGAAATIAAGTASSLPAGSTPTVTNVGTSSAAIFNFAIPSGTNGADGTTGNHYVGQGLPANNFGINGDTYTDSLTGLFYGQKTGGTWPLGATADVNAPWSHYDLSLGATYPTALLPVTRANPATAVMTNLTYWDAPGASYQTFGPNVPIQRTLEGTLFNQTSRNVFLNSIVPVTQSPTVVVGTIIVWSNHDAGVTITTSAGTATGTGFGAIVPGTPQILTITGAGTITVTKSGSGTWYACQVEYDPILPNNSVATPLIITAGAAVTRDADTNLASGALLSAFQNSTGTFVMEVSRVERQTGYGRTPALLGINNATYSLISNNTTIAHNGALVTAPMGNQTFDTSQRFGFSWGGGAQTLGAGDRVPLPYATAFIFGSVTVVRIASKDAATSGQQALCGWVKRIRWQTAKVADRLLFDTYTATAIPTVAKTPALLPGYSVGAAMPKLRAAVRLVKAGVRDAIILDGCTSHTAGVYPAVAPHANSPSAKYAVRLAAQLSIPVRFAGWFGNNNSSPSTGASIYQPDRLTFSANWTAYGTQLGGSSTKTSTNGATITDTPPGITDSYRLWYWTFPGYGTFNISDGAGHSKAVSANAAAGLAFVDLLPADGVVRGTNTFTVTATSSSPVTICGAIESDSQVRALKIINGGTSLRTALVFATDNIGAGAAENSVLEVIRQIKPDGMFYEAVTNDASALSSQSAYVTAVQAAITAGQLSGDVVVMGDPPTATGTILQANQDIYTALEYSAAISKGCPIIDIPGVLGAQAKWLAIGVYGQSTNYTDPTHLSGLGTVTGNDDIIGAIKADFITANV